MTIEEVGILNSRLEAMEGAELDELKELLDIFVSEKTCAEREKNFVEAMKSNTVAVESMARAASDISEQVGKQETRLSLIEGDIKRKRASLPVKLSIGGLAVGIFTQLEHIVAFVKKVVE